VHVKWSVWRTARGLVRADLQRLHAGPLPGPVGILRQRAELTPDQHQILSDLGLPDPPRVLAATSA
jgi:hypothetical protein